MRIGEAHPPSPRLKLARPRSQDVFYPVALRPVGEGDDVPAVGAKGVDGGEVGAAGFSTDVAHDREPWQVASHSQEQPVGEAPVEASYASGCGQLTSSFLNAEERPEAVSPERRPHDDGVPDQQHERGAWAGTANRSHPQPYEAWAISFSAVPKRPGSPSQPSWLTKGPILKRHLLPYLFRTRATSRSRASNVPFPEAVGWRLTVRLVHRARWASRGANGATRRAPRAGRPRTPRRTCG